LHPYTGRPEENAEVHFQNSGSQHHLHAFLHLKMLKSAPKSIAVSGVQLGVGFTCRTKIN
jgi:hypothetical protein